MSEQTEVIQILENIRAKRDLGVFAVEPKKTRKQQESAQTNTPNSAIVTTPIIVKSDLEKSQVKEISLSVTPLVSEVIEIVEKPKNKPTASKQKEGKIHHSQFLAKIQQAENTFSFEQKRRFYIDDKLYHTLSLLKLSTDIPNVSTFINILIAQVLEDNHKDIEAVLRELHKR